MEVINPELVGHVNAVRVDQLDLTDLVDEEHISGTLPAVPAEREAARAAFYAELRALQQTRPRRRKPRHEQMTLDLGEEP